MTRPSSSQLNVSTRSALGKRALSFGGWLIALPARGLLGLLWLYQRAISPSLPVVFGPSFGCRFAPTCSHYAADAIRTHGAALGSYFALRRLLKCTPLHPGGMDPVPPRRRPSCTSVGSANANLTSSHVTA